MISSDLTIVCPSRSRADNLLTKKLFIGFKLIVVVSNRQLPEYRLKNTEECLEFVGHPDYLKGIAAVRWWVMKKFGNVFMIDDDVDHVRNYTTKVFQTITNPEHINDIIQTNYLTARQLDAKLFGFANLKSKEYKCQNPIDFNTLVSSKSFGVMDNHGMKFNQKNTWVSGVEDYYFTLMNAHTNKYAYIDNRYCFHSLKGNQGGINDYRTSSIESTQKEGLLKMFGKAIRPSKKTGYKIKL